MRIHLPIGVFLVLIFTCLGVTQHATAFTVTEVGGSTETTAKATSEPEEEVIYCSSGRKIEVTVGAEGAGISLGYGFFDHPLGNYTPKAATTPVNSTPAKTCTIAICSKDIGTKVFTTTITGDGGSLKVKPAAAHQVESCTNERGSVDKETGCFTKCLEHGESVSKEEITGSAKEGMRNAYLRSETDLRTALEQASGKASLSGSEVERITTLADKNSYLASLYAELEPGQEVDTALKQASDQNSKLIQDLAGNTPGFFGGGGTTNSQGYFEEQLEQREQFPIPSAADASSLDPFASVEEYFVRVENCDGGKPCLVAKEIANSGDGRSSGNPFARFPSGAPDAKEGDSSNNTTFNGSENNWFKNGNNTPQAGPPPPAPPQQSTNNSFLSKAAQSFSGGFLQGLMQSLGLAPQTPAQQAATAQQQQGKNYCKQQFNANFNASKNSCECASGFEFQNNKCVSTKPTAGAVTAELNCAPTTADARTPIAIAWACLDASANTGSFTVSAEGFSAQNQASGSTRIPAQTPSDGDTMSFKLTCAKGGIQKTASCEVAVRQPSLVFVATPNPYTPGEDVTFGWSSFGTAPDAAAGDGRFCTVSSPDVPRISGAGGAGGVRKIQAHELLPQTRIFVSCKTQGGNTIEGSMIIADSEEGVQTGQTQLIVDSN